MYPQWCPPLKEVSIPPGEKKCNFMHISRLDTMLLLSHKTPSLQTVQNGNLLKLHDVLMNHCTHRQMKRIEKGAAENEDVIRNQFLLTSLSKPCRGISVSTIDEQMVAFPKSCESWSSESSSGFSVQFQETSPKGTSSACIVNSSEFAMSDSREESLTAFISSAGKC